MSATIEFGKHKGEKWADIPTSYLRWLLREMDEGKQEWQSAKAELERRGDVSEDADRTMSAWELRRMTPSEREDLQKRIEENKANPQPLEIVQIDPPYKSDSDSIFKGQWVVLVVEANSVTRMPHEQLFDNFDEANAFYEEMKAA